LLSWTHMSAFLNSVDSDYLSAAALERAYQLASNSIRLDPNLPQAHAALGYVLTFRRQHDAAIEAFEKASQLNPNFSDARFASTLVYAGQFTRAIEVVKVHMRLDPFYAPIAPGALGFAYYMLKQYEDALPPLRECILRAPNWRAGHLRLAAAYAQLGRSHDAQSEAAEVLRVEPNWRITSTRGRVIRFKFQRDEDHFVGGLRLAGLPE